MTKDQIIESQRSISRLQPSQDTSPLRKEYLLTLFNLFIVSLKEMLNLYINNHLKSKCLMWTEFYQMKNWKLKK